MHGLALRPKAERLMISCYPPNVCWEPKDKFSERERRSRQDTSVYGCERREKRRDGPCQDGMIMDWEMRNTGAADEI